MANGNKNFQIECRFLTAGEFETLHQTFLDAFSDYAVPFRITDQQLRNHFVLNAIEQERSVGAFAGGRMVGFTLNGFGEWLGRKTIYDGGTGVVPDFRRRGTGRAMFDFMTPLFRREGFEQILLEVISTNEKAIGLYEQLGFDATRRLIFFERPAPFEPAAPGGFEVREAAEPDWELFAGFGAGRPSWQNSIPAMKRTPRKIVLGAFADGRCAAYGIVFPVTGIISQLAVAPEFRGRGAATALLAEMQRRLENDGRLRASNVDESIADGVGFLRRNGFVETFSQIEMIKAI